MSNERLRRCPVCDGELDDHTRQRMGLRSGETLNELCPGRIGPSDIDHIVHNGHVDPERVALFEYKNGAPVPMGQRWLLDALSGKWTNEDGRRLHIGAAVLPQHPDDEHAALRPYVEWLFG